MLPRPSYISTHIGTRDIRYHWDEWNVASSYRPAPEDLLERLSRVTHRAQIALTIATTEWIGWRFAPLTDRTLVLDYIEAAWAGNVDLAYATYFETNDDEWRGPVLGPLNVALTIMIDGLFLGDQSANTAENPSWAYNLASLVIPEGAAFKRWHEASVLRLERHYPALAEEEEPLFDTDSYQYDPPVPREMFDPAWPVSMESVSLLIDRYLRGLTPETHPFLTTPAQLREMGFEGMPYRFPAVGQPAREGDA